MPADRVDRKDQPRGTGPDGPLFGERFLVDNQVRRDLLEETSMSTETRAIEPTANLEPLRDEWIADVDAFLSGVEHWAKTQEWATRRDPEWIEEDGLGRYQVWRLLVHSPEGRVVFKPIAREVAGATGLIDLFVLPSYEPLMLVRHEDGAWTIQPVGRPDSSKPWTESSFLETVRELFGKA
jgi:hypothetical protein